MLRISLVTETGHEEHDHHDQDDNNDDVLSRWDAALDTAEWVTLPEAAAAAGVSVSALRAWYRAGDVPSRMERGPHGQQRLVRLEDTLERAARSRRAGGSADAGSAPSGPPDTRAAPVDIVAVLGPHLARADDRADRAEAAWRDCETALREALVRAAAAEAERDVLRRLLDPPAPRPPFV